MNSRDIIISLALEYDLPTLLNYCRTSKRINDLVCNNNLFWLSKLKKDFGIILTDVKKAKTYYQEISQWMKYYPSINQLYYYAIIVDRLDLVRILLDSGADINYHPPAGPPPLLQAFNLELDGIFDYLLERGAVNTKDKAALNITSFFNYFMVTDRKTKIRISTVLFEKIFPQTYTLPEFKGFWNAARGFLERHREIMPDLYNKYIEKIRELAME